MATVGIKGLTRRDLHILIGLQVMRMLTDTDFDESQVGPYLSPLSKERRDCSSSPWKMQRTFND